MQFMKHTWIMHGHWPISNEYVVYTHRAEENSLMCLFFLFLQKQGSPKPLKWILLPIVCSNSAAWSNNCDAKRIFSVCPCHRRVPISPNMWLNTNRKIVCWLDFPVKKWIRSVRRAHVKLYKQQPKQQQANNRSGRVCMSLSTSSTTNTIQIVSMQYTDAKTKPIENGF